GHSLASPDGIVLGPGGALTGSGDVVGPVSIQNGALLSPGNSPGTIRITGNLAILEGATSKFELNGTAAGQSDLVVVTGTVSLGGSLQVTLGFAADLGTDFVIIQNDGTDPIIGTFAGLAEGAIYTAPGGATYVLSYVGGDGNDVSLKLLTRPD